MHQTDTKPNILTHDEMVCIRDFAVLPMMLTIVENNLRQIESSTYSLKKLYIEATQSLMNLIHSDLVRTKKALKESNIKVWEDDRLDSAIHYLLHLPRI